jgi:hypothetical protein
MSKEVTMLTQISGTRDGEYWPKPGGKITVDDDEAALLIRNGQASDGSEKSENALLDLHPEYAVQGVDVEGKQAVAARIAAHPAPHADEPGAYHVPPLPGERAAAEAGQEEVDKKQSDDGSVRLEVTVEPTPADDPALKTNVTSARKVTTKKDEAK